MYEGATASALLVGQFVGDPLISLRQLQLAPGQSGNGFICAGRPDTDVRLPATALLLCIGAMVGGVQRKSGSQQWR